MEKDSHVPENPRTPLHDPLPVTKARGLNDEEVGPQRPESHLLSQVPRCTRVLEEGRLTEIPVRMNSSKGKPSHTFIDYRVFLVYHEVIELFSIQIELTEKVIQIARVRPPSTATCSRLGVGQSRHRHRAGVVPGVGSRGLKVATRTGNSGGDAIASEERNPLHSRRRRGRPAWREARIWPAEAAAQRSPSDSPPRSCSRGKMVGFDACAAIRPLDAHCYLWFRWSPVGCSLLYLVQVVVFAACAAIYFLAM